MINNSVKILILNFIEKFRAMKLKTRLEIGLSILVLFFAVSAFIYSKNRKIHDLPDIVKSGRIEVLIDGNSTGFTVKNGVVSGFQYEIIKLFADSLGVELVVSEQNDLMSGIADLKRGDYDIVATFFPILSNFKKDLEYTIPIQNTRQVLVQLAKNDSIKRNTIQKHVQLANDTIYMPTNSPYKMRLEHLSDEIASPILIEEMSGVSTEQLVRFVSIGKVKSTICDEMLALKLKTVYPNIDISVPIGFSQQQAWLVNKKSKKLLIKLNEFLSDFIGSSAYWNLYRKYYN